MLLAILVFTYAVTVYAKANWSMLKNDTLQTVVLLFVLTNPFAMENLSYRFDCLIMFTALSIAFFLYSLPCRLPKYVYLVVSASASVIIMCIYQPAICMCIILCVINVFLCLTGKEVDPMAEGCRIAGIGLGAIFYKCVIATHVVSTTDWRQNASHLVRPEQLYLVWENMKSACRYIMNRLAGSGRPPVCVIVAIFLLLYAVTIAIIGYCRENAHRSIGNRLVHGLLICVCLVAAFFATFMPLLFLKNMALKSRMLIAFGGLLLFGGVMILFYSLKSGKIAIVLCAMCILFHFSLMYTYTNALASQMEYNKYMVYHIAHDIETINSSGEYSLISIVGDAPRARQTERICEKYPLISELVPYYFANDEWIGGVWLYRYLQDGVALQAIEDSDAGIVQRQEPRADNALYSCYTDGDRIIVLFK